MESALNLDIEFYTFYMDLRHENGYKGRVPKNKLQKYYTFQLMHIKFDKNRTYAINTLSV